jgi:hypothetical protein
MLFKLGYLLAERGYCDVDLLGSSPEMQLVCQSDCGQK